MSATPQVPPLAKIEKKTIIDLISRRRRIDERSATDYRPIKIEVGPIGKANGSAHVHLGKTKILAGIKIEPGKPFPDTPDEGVLTVNAELVPLASPSFEPGPPDENSIELARVVDRGIRESKAIDLRKLCISPGEKVLVVYVDVYVLDHDGNLIDASSIAAMSALLNARMNEYVMENGEVIMKSETHRLPVQNYPVPVTTAKIDNTLILDPCLEEEQVMSSRLTITTDKDKKLCAIQKGGLGLFTPDEVKTGARMSIDKGAEIRNLILEATK